MENRMAHALFLSRFRAAKDGPSFSAYEPGSMRFAFPSTVPHTTDDRKSGVALIPGFSGGILSIPDGFRHFPAVNFRSISRRAID
jgi:hypothetical protein